MNASRLKRIFLSTLFLTLPFNSSSLLANELFNNNKYSTFIAEAKGYREHDDKSENEDDFHWLIEWKYKHNKLKEVRYIDLSESIDQFWIL